MNRKFASLVVLIALFSQCGIPKKESAEARAKAMLSKMTLEEKAGQMTQLSIEMISQGQGYDLVKPHALDTNKLKEVIVNLGVGSILNVGGHTYPIAHWKEIITSVQNYASQTRLQIPVLYGIDAIHGANYTQGSTLYPQQIALAASFNPALAKQMARLVAKDVEGSGIPWNFSPVLDVARNPLWPRFWETFGEDPYLASQMGVAMVEGYQEKGANGRSMAACLKHYVGYGNPANGHDRTPAYIPERQLREIYLPPFANAIKAGAKTIMINSGEWNGEPVHASKFLLKTILRDELKFKGVTVTDWEDIKNLTERHHIAATYKEAVALAINAGIDLAMVPLDLEYTKYLIENVKEGAVTETRINEAVLRILTLKYELGLFDEPYTEANSFVEPGSKESLDLSYELATQSIVLLKNNNSALPLAAGEKVLVTGPNANYINALNGGWTHTWQGRDTAYNPVVPTIKEALNLALPTASYLGGNTYTQHLPEASLLAAANGYSTVVLCLGEDTYTEKPGDINDLELDAAQQDLIRIYKNAGKKVVLVLVEGRPRTFTKSEALCDAILYAALPGNSGATAIADILVGKVNPSAKLPFSFPMYGATHSTYDCKYTELLNNDFKPAGYNALFEFGHGLSYTQFAYSKFSMDKRELGKQDSIQAHVTITNTGTRAGSEIVLLYSTDVVASITPSVKRLRSFTRVDLQPGESKQVDMKLAASDLSFVGLQNKFILEPGKFYFNVAQLKDSVNITN
ncbi:MAG: beta-glucosidase [Bacteroidetes bacterium B1(2017)]|nr:MAG: beta-glucosidase [Bacteroidetes bacterium B1(2017)]